MNSESNNFVDVVLTKIQENKQNKLKSDLQTVKEKYVSGLKNSEIDITSDGMILINLTRIIHYSVVFIEKNAQAIAKLVGEVVTSDFKLSTCVRLIMDITNALIPDNQIAQYINHFVDILFPKEDIIKEVKDDKEDKATIRSNGSIKKSWKYILTKSGCVSK